MVGDGFGKSAVDTVGAAPVTVIFTEGDQGRVGVEFVDDRFEESVTHIVGNEFGNFFAVFVETETFFGLDLFEVGVLFQRHGDFRFTVIEFLNKIGRAHV